MTSPGFSMRLVPFFLGVIAAVVLSPVLTEAQATPSSISFNFTSITYPGATSTGVGGINQAGIIVGAYGGNETHGFVLLPNGTFQKLDYPGARSTSPSGINDSNEIVGSYSDSEGNSHGFLFTPPNTFSTISCGEPKIGSAVAINNGGEIVGELYRMPRGFALQEGTCTPVNDPNGRETYAEGINSSGVISGWWIQNDNGHVHGFLLTSLNGTYTDVDYPGASDTYVNKINDISQIVGSYYAAGQPFENGFVAAPANNQYLTIHYPGSTYTMVEGINNSGYLVGTYGDAQGGSHGFLAVPK